MISIITGRRASTHVLVWRALAGAGLIVAAGCDKVPLLAPSLSTISLSANSSIVQANGTAEIRATVLESSGTSVQNGTTVTFSTNLGTVSPAETRSINGVATVQFVANDQSGIAEIHANSGSAKSADSASTTSTSPSIKLTVGGAAAARVQVIASPGRVPAAGGSSTIAATVSDSGGNALTGVPVVFTTDAGTLSTAVATSSSSGQALTTLTTNRDATVTATAGATTGTTAISGTVKVTVTSLPLLSVALASGATTVEDQAVAFTVPVTGTLTTDAFQSVVTNFGDGKSANLGALAASTSLSHVYSSDGTYTVTVTGTGAGEDTTSASTVITISRRAPLTMSLSASPTSAAVGAVVTFTVVTPTTGTVARSVTLTFGVGEGEVSLGGVTGTTSVVHTYSSSGTFTVTATATDTLGGTSTASTQVVITPKVPLGVTIAPTTSPFSTATPVTFTATVTPSTTANILSCAWNFWEPSSSTNTVTTTGNTTTHQYATKTTYTVTVTVMTTDGNTGNGQIQIAVTLP